MEPYAQRRILLAKELVGYFESVQEFVVAESGGAVVGCGALHVMWDDLAEIRTLAVAPEHLGTGWGTGWSPRSSSGPSPWGCGGCSA